MGDYKYIHKISEERIKEKIKHFVGYKDLLDKYVNIANLIFNDNTVNNMEILELLDISGKILMHGIPGTGKTSLAYYISNYYLVEDEIESYKLSIPDLIKSDLGATTKNMNNAIKEINSLNEEDKIILILDELDRISVKRNSKEEISELKRTLIEFMDFLDGIRYKNKMLIIGITNSLELLDSALIRRFDFVDEIKPDENDLVKLFDLITDKMELKVQFTENNKLRFVSIYNTGDKIKKYFKQLYVNCEGENIIIKEALEQKMRGVLK